MLPANYSGEASSFFFEISCGRMESVSVEEMREIEEEMRMEGDTETVTILFALGHLVCSAAIK
jgi:hypothetical protein